MKIRKKRIVVSLLAGLLVLGVTACEKKEEAEEAPAAGHEMGAGHEMPGGHEMMGGGAKGPKQVVVSDEVKAAWTAVSIVVKNKKTGEINTYEVKPESEFVVPNSNLRIQVGAYLPDFSMGPGTIESRSAEPNNPALQITVLENGTEKYKGWLFAKFPDMHAFEHPEYSITMPNKGAEGSSHPSM